MMKHILFSVFFFLLSTTIGFAWGARVIHVADGDTVIVEPFHGGKQVTVRLYGIDCPEKDQIAGQGARGFVLQNSLYKNVEVEERARDRYGRTVAILTLIDSRVVLQESLLKSGFAWVFPRYCEAKLRRQWKALEDEAKLAARGVWATDAPVPPWEWRKYKRTKKALVLQKHTEVHIF